MMEAGVYELQVQGAGALALAEEPTIALLVADEAGVQWWGPRLESALSGARSGHGVRNALKVLIQPWSSVLPVVVRDIHVIGADTLPIDVLARLESHGALLNLHHFDSSDHSESMLWRSESDLAAYLEKLVANLSGQAGFGMRWDDYALHLRQPGRRVGRHARGADWQTLLPVLLDSPEQAWQATSVILFLDGGADLTLGHYVEVCNWLDSRLPARCLVTVSVLTGDGDPCSATLLLTTLQG
ncbi:MULTISPECIES: hypothetical protein [Pseudomonas aeruginosa group]|uniref:hypothetical protein n=1 Tax=Pseudomonas aeruginosa group TaxID=136841 RepID=UPI0003B9CC1E|nr:MULTISPECIES: hypothetical protein [Pseudomonas aeruginosa group]ESR68188.1 hypothetical protein T266_27425 [Pseudomonas aeruginosa VRFPA05]ALV79041.1 hypothetical protein AOY09_03997 [Pseudomonas aeruginosa]EIU1415705.1 hypothetical protein [Pseudomonas aeruginosa]EIU4874223.1 hypothetical protein [Pseudomonas aeruginosa]EJV1364781.1 hypothetical protein [Pseudomonas aeruginosa]